MVTTTLPYDPETVARAMTPREKRRYLEAAGWRSNQAHCWHGQPRPAERWGRYDGYRPYLPDNYPFTLGQAIRVCLAEEVLA